MIRCGSSAASGRSESCWARTRHRRWRCGSRRRSTASAGGALRPATRDDYDAGATPLEALVEREPLAAATLRQRLDAWSRLVALLAEAGLSDRTGDLAAAHPLPPPRVADDGADARLRRLAGDRAGDGLAVAAGLAADPAGLPATVVEPFVAWARAQAPPGAGDCWVTDRLEYRFSLGAATDDGEVVLTAPEHLGGHVEWYDLDIDPDPGHTLGTPPITAASSISHVLPARVRFPGMPAERFWELEDAAVDLGAVSAAAEDLGRLVTVEFATVFGNDWWQVPIRAGFGSLVGVRSLIVRDSFGENVVVEPTERATPARAPWRMFRLSDASLAAGAGPAPPLLLLAAGHGRWPRR